jgi:copper chaperone
METLKFKTNIKCNNCVEKVSHYMDVSEKITEWNVDLKNPDRVLTVTGKGISEEYIKDTLLKAGYKAEILN